MAEIRLGDEIFECADGQSVLDTLLASGRDIPYSCKTGLCLTCMMRCTDGRLPDSTQVGIKDTLKSLGYFLPCVCRPETNLTLTLPNEADLFSRASVLAVEPLSENICRVVLEPATPLYYRAGQFLNLRRADGLVRSYSLASVPHLDPHLELHVKRLPRGQMSNWIYDHLEPGDSLDIQGPNGSCFYLPNQTDQAMLMIGNGSGLAPLIGIARDALHSSHAGEIRLYHGSRGASGLYLRDELLALESDFANFHYFPCVSREQPQTGYRAGRAETVAAEDLPDLAGWRVFLCGYPPMVKTARKACYLAGAAMADIHCDPFDLKELRKTPRE